MSMRVRPSVVLILTLSLVLIGSSLGQVAPSDQPKPTTEPLPGPVRTNEPGGSPLEPKGVTDVEIQIQLREAEQKFDRILTEATLPDSTRINPKFDAAKIPELKQSAQQLLQRIDAMLSSDKVMPTRRDESRLKKLSVLYEASKIDRSVYGPQFDAYVDQLLTEARKDEGEQRRTASIVTAYRMLDRYVDSKEPNTTVLPALEQYIQTYPTVPFGIELLLRRARNLYEAGDTAGALEVYHKTEESFKEGDNRREMVRTVVKRMELQGQPASIKGPTLDGREFDLAAYRGKVVLVDFWASWCGPCMENLGKLTKLYEKYHDKGLEIVGVVLDDNRDEVKQVLDRQSIAWPQILFDGDAQKGFDNPIAQTYAVNFIPMMFLIDKSGNFAATEFSSVASLDRAIAKALGGPVSAGGAGSATKSPPDSEPKLVPVPKDQGKKP